MQDKELWKSIQEFPNYEISNFGRVRSLPRFVSTHNSKKPFKREGKILKILNVPKKYSQISFRINGKQYTRLIHRLVAKAFIPNPKNKPEVNHIDANRHNNHVSNLEWVTKDENLSHAIAKNLVPIGENHYKSKKILNIITGETIGSASQAAKLYGLSKQSLNRYLLSKEVQKISFLKYIE